MYVCVTFSNSNSNTARCDWFGRVANEEVNIL